MEVTVTVLLVPFLPGNLKGRMNWQLLQETVDHGFTHILEHSDQYNKNKMTIQKDGTLPQYFFTVRQYLN